MTSRDEFLTPRHDCRGDGPAGRLTGRARADRLAKIREMIADGSYDTAERLEAAVEGFLSAVGERP
jgi:hypothetical protein